MVLTLEPAWSQLERPVGRRRLGHSWGFRCGGWGPRVCTTSRGPGDSDVAGMGTSEEEPLSESVATSERAQHLFGENNPKAQPTQGRSGGRALGGRSKSQPMKLRSHSVMVTIRNSRRLKDPAPSNGNS